MSVDRYLLLETPEDYNKFLNSEFKNPGAAWHYCILNGKPIDFGSSEDNYPKDLEGQILTVENVDKLIASLKETSTLEKKETVKKNFKKQFR